MLRKLRLRQKKVFLLKRRIFTFSFRRMSIKNPWAKLFSFAVLKRSAGECFLVIANLFWPSLLNVEIFQILRDM